MLTRQMASEAYFSDRATGEVIFASENACFQEILEWCAGSGDSKQYRV